MKTIYILVSNQALATSIAGPMDMFQIANTLWRRQAGKDSQPVFEIKTVGIDGKTIECKGGIRIQPDLSIEQVQECDLILVAANHFTHKEGLKKYVKELSPSFVHLHRLAAKGTIIAGYCSATFALAAAGLLNGKPATTSWFFKDYFHECFAEVDLQMDRLIVNHGNIWTAGATTSYLELCLKLVEFMVGQQLATLLSKVMLLDATRISQQPFITINTLIEHSDETIAECQEWLQLNLAQEITLDEMSERSAMSKRNFIRRFKKAVGETPAVYVQNLRVEAAKRYLEHTDLKISQIQEKIGYDDTSAFRKVFQKITSLTPKAYRDKFSATQNFN